MAVFNPDDPFLLGLTFGSQSGEGANDQDDDSCVGQLNHCIDMSNNSTVFLTFEQPGAGLYAVNCPWSQDFYLTASWFGYVGLFGRTFGSTRSVGVLGVTQSTCGVLGITGSRGNSPIPQPGGSGVLPPPPAGTPPIGIGVAGRAMDGTSGSSVSLDTFPGTSVGVFGTSVLHAGVVGHAGPLAPVSSSGDTSEPKEVVEILASGMARGGIFSAGELAKASVSHDASSKLGVIIQDVTAGAPLVETVAPQLGLVPALALPIPAPLPITANALNVPCRGCLGDLFATAEPLDGRDAPYRCRLWLCIDASIPAEPLGPAWMALLLMPAVPGPVSKTGPTRRVAGRTSTLMIL